MPDDPERLDRLERYLQESGITVERGQYLLYGMVLQQYVDNELGDDGDASLLLHTQKMLESNHQPELVKGVMQIFGVNTKLVDDINDLDSEVGFDVGDSPYDQD